MPELKVEVSKEIESKLKDTSKLLGVNEQAVVDRAIITYLNSLGREIQLKKESRQWDKMSDEAFLDFESSLEE